MFAIQFGRADAVKILVDAKADVNYTNTRMSEMTAFMHAAEAGLMDAIRGGAHSAGGSVVGGAAVVAHCVARLLYERHLLLRPLPPTLRGILEAAQHGSKGCPGGPLFLILLDHRELGGTRFVQETQVGSTPSECNISTYLPDLVMSRSLRLWTRQQNPFFSRDSD